MRKTGAAMRPFLYGLKYLIDHRLLRKTRPLIRGLVLTNRCNLRCPHCRLATRGQKDLSFAQVTAAIDAFYEEGGRCLYLEGGEPVEIKGASQDGPLRFRLPICHMQTRVRIAGRDEEPPLRLETVLIEPDDRRLCLTWRAAVACDKQALKVESLEIAVDELDPSGEGE